MSKTSKKATAVETPEVETEEVVETPEVEEEETSKKATAKKLKSGNYTVTLKNPTEIDWKLYMPGDHEVTEEQYGRISLFIS